MHLAGLFPQPELLYFDSIPFGLDRFGNLGPAARLTRTQDITAAEAKKKKATWLDVHARTTLIELLLISAARVRITMNGLALVGSKHGALLGRRFALAGMKWRFSSRWYPAIFHHFRHRRGRQSGAIFRRAFSSR
jgi:hypothetical protein